MVIHDNTVLERKRTHFGEKTSTYPPDSTSLSLARSTNHPPKPLPCCSRERTLPRQSSQTVHAYVLRITVPVVYFGGDSHLLQHPTTQHQSEHLTPPSPLRRWSQHLAPVSPPPPALLNIPRLPAARGPRRLQRRRFSCALEQVAASALLLHIHRTADGSNLALVHLDLDRIEGRGGRAHRAGGRDVGEGVGDGCNGSRFDDGRRAPAGACGPCGQLRGAPPRVTVAWLRARAKRTAHRTTGLCISSVPRPSSTP